MEKKVCDLKRGDVLVVNGVRFTIDQIAETPDGRTLILFKDIPATPENLEAYGSLLKKMGVLRSSSLPENQEVLEYQGDKAILKWPEERPRSYEEYRQAYAHLFCGGVDNIIKEVLKEDEH